MPALNILSLPTVSPNLPNNKIRQIITSVFAVTTHSVLAIVTPNSSATIGRATLMLLLSTQLMKVCITTANRINQRF